MKKIFKVVSVLAMLFVVLAVSAFTKDAPDTVKVVTDYAPVVASVGLVDADLLNTLNEKFILKKFRHVGTWIQEITSKNQWVANDSIKIPKRKGDNAPTVLINNAVYPIATSGRQDEHVTVSLNKYDTENREVTRDELYAIAYDKEGDVNLELKEELEEQTTDHLDTDYGLDALQFKIKGKVLS